MTPLVCLLTWSAVADAASAPALSVRALGLRKFTPDLVERLDRGEAVRVWVRTVRGADSSSARAKQVLAKHPELRQKYTVGYAGMLNLSELRMLDANPDVLDVMADPVLRPGTTDVIPLINADDVVAMEVAGVNVDGTGNNVVILDSGIDSMHTELIDRTIMGPDFVDPGTAPIDSTTAGHGTAIAGVVARTAPGCKVIAVRVCDGDGCYGSDMMAGTVWCADHRDSLQIAAINMSIQGETAYTEEECPRWMYDYLQQAYDSGITIVVCAGNHGLTTGVSHPACSPFVISVGNSFKSDTSLNPSSDRGPNLDVVAPGTLIGSTYYYWWDPPRSGTCLRSGTSIAAPFVSAAVALVRHYGQLMGYLLTPDEIEDLLKQTGKTIDQWPRIDVLAAIQRLAQTTGRVPLPARAHPLAQRARIETSAQSSTIRITFGAAQKAALTVSSLSGRVVRTLEQGTLPPGPSWVTWDATNEAGQPVPPGVYVFRLLAGSSAWQAAMYVGR